MASMALIVASMALIVASMALIVASMRRINLTLPLLAWVALP